MARGSILARALGLGVVAAVGAGVALGIAGGLGKLGSRTTVVQQQSAPATNASLQQAPRSGLTPEEIYRRDAPGVVQITATSTTTTSDPFGFAPPSTQTEQSLGSGFVLDKAGHIVTNEHVIAGAQKIQVSFSGNDQIQATVVGSDPSTDIAVLKIDTHARALTPLPLGNSDAVNVGDAVYAIGNPFGYTRTLTSGLVSAVQRQITAPNSLPIDNAIQTDAAINHGNSGGPLIDAGAQVIGVTSQISTGNTGQQGSLGIGFAIPINTVRTVAAQLIKTGKVEHPFLGISVLPITAQLAKLFNLPTKSGLLVDRVDSGTSAAKAGIKAGTTSVIVSGTSYRLGGDIIVSVDGTPVATFEQLRDAIDLKKPGEKVALGLYRHGAKTTVKVTLGQAPK
ncbi:MAG TPA: trypsin-like peptidase domain-containing protein [Gaiellaceae bacterium]|nr:trypsin-like peptidase domain-containing protein [Gaiellaceae bacterium]